MGAEDDLGALDVSVLEEGSGDVPTASAIVEASIVRDPSEESTSEEGDGTATPPGPPMDEGEGEGPDEFNAFVAISPMTGVHIVLILSTDPKVMSHVTFVMNAITQGCTDLVVLGAPTCSE